MKNGLQLLLVVCLTATWIGCQSATEPPTRDAQATSGVTSGTNETASSELTLVSLKVPNMT